MASEVLAVPEAHLLEVIGIIRTGLKNTKEVTPAVKKQLTQWCDEEESLHER